MNKIIEVFEYLCKNENKSLSELFNVSECMVDTITHDVIMSYISTPDTDKIVNELHKKYSGNELALALCILYDAPLLLEISSLRIILNKCFMR